jgi:hypothetical protein
MRFGLTGARNCAECSTAVRHARKNPSLGHVLFILSGLFCFLCRLGRFICRATRFVRYVADDILPVFATKSAGRVARSLSRRLGLLGCIGSCLCFLLGIRYLRM